MTPRQHNLPAMAVVYAVLFMCMGFAAAFRGVDPFSGRVRVEASQNPIPGRLTGVLNPGDAMLSAFYMASSTPGTYNRTATFSASFNSGDTGTGVRNYTTYCDGSSVVAATTSPNLIFVTQDATTHTISWDLRVNTSSPLWATTPLYPCVTKGNCLNFLLNYWAAYGAPQYDPDDCVSCVAGYCVGIAVSDGTNIISNTETCATYLVENNPYGQGLFYIPYMNTTHNITSACECDSIAAAVSPIHRIAQYNQQTQTCMVAPACDTTRTSLYDTTFTGNSSTSLGHNVITRTVLFQPSATGAADNYDQGTSVECSAPWECTSSANSISDPAHLFIAAVNKTYANYSTVIGRGDLNESLYGTSLVTPMCIRGVCYPTTINGSNPSILPATQSLGQADGVGACGEVVRKCDLVVEGIRLYTHGKAVNLNTSMFNELYNNPCNAFGNGEVVQVYSDDCPDTVTVDSNNNYLLRASAVAGIMQCTLKVACVNGTGYTCNAILPPLLSSPDIVTGSIYNIFTSGVSAGPLRAVLLPLFGILLLLV